MLIWVLRFDAKVQNVERRNVGKIAEIVENAHRKSKVPTASVR
jgi:hypothetical protein